MKIRSLSRRRKVTLLSKVKTSRDAAAARIKTNKRLETGGLRTME